MSEYLIHFGIKGQKWGRRNYQYEDGSLTPAGKARYNKNYSKKQRMSDRALYGEGGVNRINRHMNNGYSIKAARSIEAQRIRSHRVRARKGRNVGALVGSIAGATIGTKITKYSIALGANAIASMIGGKEAGKKTGRDVYDYLNSGRTSLYVRAGTAYLWGNAGRDIGRNLGMGAYGGKRYRPEY